MGVIAKRPVGNEVLGKSRSPYPYADEYFRRDEIMSEQGPIEDHPGDPHVLSMGFVLASQEVDTVIVGTHNPEHVLSNVKLVEEDLPISNGAVLDLYSRFDEHGHDWLQLT